MGRMKLINIYLLCIIVIIGLLSVGLDLIGFIPFLGTALKALPATVLEALQVVSAGIITFSRFIVARAKESKNALSAFMRICMFCAFVAMSVLETGGNALSALPFVGAAGEVLADAMINLIQIALAAALLLFDSD